MNRSKMEYFQKKALQKISIGFVAAFVIALFIQFTDYIKSYILYISAKKTLFDMYAEETAVKEMKSQANVVDYLSGLSTDAMQQIFYITATFAFIAAIVLLILFFSKRA